MFKNVKLMKNGWLKRYTYDLIIVSVLIILLFLFHLFIYFRLGSTPNVWVAISEELILVVIALFNLNSVNKLIEKHHNEQFEYINHVLNDLHTVSKIYDKFFTLFISLIPFIFLILAAFLTSGIISLILNDLAYFLILMGIGSLMDTLFASKHLKEFYKQNK